jgi:hypothetical protein
MKKVIFILFAVLLLNGCNKTELPPPDGGGYDIVLSITKHRFDIEGGMISVTVAGTDEYFFILSSRNLTDEYGENMAHWSEGGVYDDRWEYEKNGAELGFPLYLSHLTTGYKTPWFEARREIGNKISIKVAPNSSGKERSFRIVLSSRTIEYPIEINQSAE